MPQPLLAVAAPVAHRRRRGRIIPLVVVAAGFAGLACLPALLPRLDVAPGVEPLPSISLDDMSAGGKIALRYRADEEGEQAGRPASLLMPASLVMPMSIGWERASPAEPARRAAPSAPVRAVVTEASLRRPAMPPARPAQFAEAAPMPIVPAAIATTSAPSAPAEERGFVRLVSAPVSRLAGAVSGAAGAVGAAGSWTIAQAAGFVPRW